jgi:hypothetical protein
MINPFYRECSICKTFWDDGGFLDSENYRFWACIECCDWIVKNQREGLAKLINKVIWQKGRVWTIYSYSGGMKPGIFCYQGLKPYPSFKYDSYRDYYPKKKTSYFRVEDLNFIEGDEIEKYLKQMESEDKKKLTRTKAIKFYMQLTGHSKNFVSKNLKENYNDSFEFSPGAICFELWKTKGILLLSHDIHGSIHHAYFDFITFESDSNEEEKSREDYKQQIIDDFKDWKGIE